MSGQVAEAKTRTASARLTPTALDKIDARMRQLLRETAVPGAALAIIQDGEVSWQRAYGVKDTATGAPVDADTVFEAASVSKTAFAYVALKLCEKGTLGLDVPLTRYTKQRFFADDPRLDEVTARHALAHTTGFPDWRSGSPLRCESKPGERFLYSGEGYYYLQSVLTELVGRRLAEPCGRYEADLEVCATDFDDFMRRSLLEPLGMAASGYVWREGFAAHAARPHDLQGRPLPPKRPNAGDVARYGAVGELRTTVADYGKFLRAVLTRPKGDAFLGAAMHAEMVRPQVKLGPEVKIDGADSWALGWAVQERPTGHVILHSGGQAGFRSLTMASLARKSGFVIFTNSDKGSLICYDRTLGDLLTPLLAG
ncbi:MAG: serine hydrolase domain-containing protein [Verrucomicrobiota bacterium]